jgi:hypothetical protein
MHYVKHSRVSMSRPHEAIFCDMLLAEDNLAVTDVCFTVFVCRTSSQTVASSSVQQLGGGSTGSGSGRCGHLHHHVSVEELRLIQVKNVATVSIIKYH